MLKVPINALGYLCLEED